MDQIWKNYEKNQRKKAALKQNNKAIVANDAVYVINLHQRNNALELFDSLEELQTFQTLNESINVKNFQADLKRYYALHHHLKTKHVTFVVDEHGYLVSADYDKNENNW